MGEILVILLCSVSILLGICLVAVGLADENITTSPLTASAGAFIVAGALGMVFLWRLVLRQGKTQASKWIALCVGIVVVATSALMIYVANLGFGSPHPVSPTVSFSNHTVAGGEELTVAGMTGSDALWGDLQIMLSDGSDDMVTWQLSASDWTVESDASSYSSPPRMLGTIEVWMNITDVSEEGRLDAGDSLVITTGSPYEWDPSKKYTLMIIHEPTAASACVETLHF